jgi:O-antigen/teichoic acid export membrane protein
MIMSTSTRFLLKGTLLTVSTYGFGQLLRLVTNVILARILAPDLFGIMTIVISLRVGIELVTDAGIGQNIVYNKNANDPDFYNTAWTLQAIRGLVLWLIAIVMAWPVSLLYQYPVLLFIIPLTTIGTVLTGFTSISRFLLQKRLKIVQLNVFDAFISLVSSAGFVLFAYLSPTIWSLVFGDLFGSMATMIGSFFLLSDVKERFHLRKSIASEILQFGKWIFVSSFVYFLSTNFDRLYLAKVVSLQLLGVYGIARTISEPLGLLMGHLGNNLLFPFVAAEYKTRRSDLREQLAALRAKLLLLAAFGVSVFITTADLAIKILYDDRYQAAGWMLPILIIGSWFSILASLNESILIGLGKPAYGAISNGLKFAFLLIGLPLGVKCCGLFGGVIVVALANVSRYIPVLVGQKRERFSFIAQDLLITFAMFALSGVWEWLRWVSGYGTSFDSLPLEMNLFVSAR